MAFFRFQLYYIIKIGNAKKGCNNFIKKDWEISSL